MITISNIQDLKTALSYIQDLKRLSFRLRYYRDKNRIKKLDTRQERALLRHRRKAEATAEKLNLKITFNLDPLCSPIYLRENGQSWMQGIGL